MSLITVLAISCKSAPKMERTPEIWLVDQEMYGLITAHDEGEICEGRVIDDYCFIPLEMADSHLCLGSEDATMVFDYINLLLRKCKRWQH